MSRKHSSWKDNEIVYCHLLTRNLASCSVRQLFDGPTHRWMSSLRFSHVDAFNLSPNMCHTLNPLDLLHIKSILRIIIKISFAYCSLNSANPYTFKYLNNGGQSKMTTLTPSAKSFTGGPNASKPVSSLITKTMGHIRHPPPPHKKCNIIIIT